MRTFKSIIAVNMRTFKSIIAVNMWLFKSIVAVATLLKQLRIKYEANYH